ncbi:PepSY domain-containing protein [Heyndrickxia ginsengihumi]|uniref:Peptidase M4 n=1 Tax=Heyndrickxia ginsengihumi TaxID=363870 RepID=A0A0A6VCD9_9BACI|nr:PepSY domain-containing protein [Heyndrickxia ginsengihumi]KHD85930.1 peptidase M4 [Heyndrickxia ginsengihumi]MBE6185038.1 hypothetical protein [Bacillus sp. (in: firmicutes)]MCM3022065.1 PepSY domain-containing protein [Heyndrickxia ginsengihumi]NEY20985.1 hypothetical protein [Heyndrickxia ginsengihumi]
MNWKTFVAGVAVGAIGGHFVSQAIKKNQTISAETVLANVKKAFKANGTVDGSWIQTTVDNYEKHPIKTEIYRGGISFNENGERNQYEFIADAKTGSIIDVYPI